MIEAGLVLKKAIKKRSLEEKSNELKKLIDEYNEKIDNYNQKIIKADKAYESLTKFKLLVTRSRTDFSILYKIGPKSLEKRLSVSNNNTVAREYYNGMQRILSGTGANISNFLYQAILDSIQSEMDSIKNTSEDYLDKIDCYKRLLNEVEKEYEAVIRELNNL